VKRGNITPHDSRLTFFPLACPTFDVLDLFAGRVNAFAPLGCGVKRTAWETLCRQHATKISGVVDY
jgi:hypothetical protein